MKLCARNQIKGKVLEIRKGGVNCSVVLDIGNGQTITATNSLAGIEELGLKVGDEAYAVFKAISVMVGTED